MNGRIPPPRAPIVFVRPRVDDPSQALDAAYFARYLERYEYMREYIAGETVDPMPPGTWVYVTMIDGERVRGFAPPPGGLN